MPKQDQSDRVLGLFAKKPIPGQVKTRLAAETSPAWATRVAEALLRDTVEQVAGIDAHRVLAFAPPGAEQYFADMGLDRFDLVPQSEGDLGQRMASFFALQFQKGARRVVLVGADSPTLPRDYILEAFDRLHRANIVLGPAKDGGYYLIGCAERLPPIFGGIAWGSSRVLAETIAYLSDPEWRLELLPPWYDVDTLADWHMLVGHVSALQRAGIDPGVPNVESLMVKPASPKR